MTGAEETTDRAVREASVAIDMEGCEAADLCKQPHKPASGVYVSHDLLRGRGGPDTFLMICRFSPAAWEEGHRNPIRKLPKHIPNGTTKQ